MEQNNRNEDRNINNDKNYQRTWVEQNQLIEELKQLSAQYAISTSDVIDDFNDQNLNG